MRQSGQPQGCKRRSTRIGPINRANQHVVSERGLDHIARLAPLECEGRLERREYKPFLEPPQVAAARTRFTIGQLQRHRSEGLSSEQPASCGLGDGERLALGAFGRGAVHPSPLQEHVAKVNLDQGKALDDVDPERGLDQPTDLAHVECKRGAFEVGLHRAAAERTE